MCDKQNNERKKWIKILNDNESFVSYLIKEHIPEESSEIEELFKKALRNSPRRIMQASTELREVKSVMIEAVKAHIDSFNYVSEKNMQIVPLGVVKRDRNKVYPFEFFNVRSNSSSGIFYFLY